jgi:hypothetical protein
VLVVLTRGIQDGSKSSKLIADISRMIYGHTTGAYPTTLPTQ